MPSGLCRDHRIAASIWGCVVVRDGRLWYSAATTRSIVDAGRTQAIASDIEHHVEPLGPVHLFIEFYAIDRPLPQQDVGDPGGSG